MTCDTKPCYSITITDSTFSRFSYNMTNEESPVLVNSDFGLQYQGKILNLNNFQGPITISSSSFLYNTLALSGGCNLFLDDNLDYNSDEDKYFIYRERSYLQIKNLISIRQHQTYSINIEENAFTANSNIKGVIYIETVFLNDTSEAEITLKSNKFDQNFGYFNASAVSIRRIS